MSARLDDDGPACELDRAGSLLVWVLTAWIVAVGCSIAGVLL